MQYHLSAREFVKNLLRTKKIFMSREKANLNLTAVPATEHYRGLPNLGRCETEAGLKGWRQLKY